MNKVVFLTGASSGIGKTIFEYLKEKDIEVYGASRSLEDSLELHTFKLDVSDELAVKNVIEKVIAINSRLDALINVAGFGISGAVEDTPTEAIKREIDTNLFGTIYTIKAALPHMRNQKEGIIINFSSIAGLVGLPYQAFYSTSKFAVEGFSEALRYEVEQFGIKVVVIEPGDFKTNFTQRREKYTKENSPYFEKFYNAVTGMEKDEKAGSNPEIIAELVYKIVQSKNPKHKYLVGPAFEKSFAIVKRILPESLTTAIFKWYYGL